MTNPCQGHAAESARAEHMKEAERLMRQYTTAVLERNYEAIALYHFTLLAHIQRGVVPEALDPEFLIGYLEEREDWQGREVLIERIRQAAAPAPDQFRDATKMIEPAEVPMPEPVAYGIGNTSITGSTNRLMMVRIVVPLNDQYAGAGWHPLVLADEAHTYGVACRAAGEAAGYARGLAEAGRDAEKWGNAVQKLTLLPAFLAGWKLSDSCIRNDMGTEAERWLDGLSELYKLYSAAALRGEVK